MTPSDIKATISFSDGSPSIEMPIYKGTVGPDVIDISKLYGKTGKFTYDPGFMSTASCSSKITYIDGDKGELLYRGYPIDELAVNCDFLETCFLLLNGKLPNQKEKTDFDHLVMHHTMVHEQMQFFLRGFRRDAHPMAVLTGLVGGMAAFYHDGLDYSDAKVREIAQIRLVAKMPTLVAMAYKYSIGQPFTLRYGQAEIDMVQTGGGSFEPKSRAEIIERWIDDFTLCETGQHVCGAMSQSA